MESGSLFSVYYYCPPQGRHQNRFSARKLDLWVTVVHVVIEREGTVWASEPKALPC